MRLIVNLILTLFVVVGFGQSKAIKEFSIEKQKF